METKTRATADIQYAAQTLIGIAETIGKAVAPSPDRAFPEDIHDVDAAVKRAGDAIDTIQEALRRFREAVYDPTAAAPNLPQRKPKPFSEPVKPMKRSAADVIKAKGIPRGLITFKLTGKHRQPVARRYYCEKPKTSSEKQAAASFKTGFKLEAKQLQLQRAFKDIDRFTYFKEDYDEIRRLHPGTAASYCYGVAAARLEKTFEEILAKRESKHA